MDALLIAARALHFVAAIALFGTFAFDCFVAAPALRAVGVDTALLRRHLWLLAWAGLGLLAVSGAAWLAAIATDMSGKPLGAVLSGGTLGAVLTKTRFGEDWLLRLGAAVGLGGLLAAASTRSGAAYRWVGLALGLFLLASLAWAGHGAATPGAPGALHLAGDILHLLGAGTWLGTLPPFVLLLALARRRGDSLPQGLIRAATRRLSGIAVIGVVGVLVGGGVNTWFVAGTVPALVGTDYGRLLLAKITLFVAMLIIAAVNLLRLSPRLGTGAEPGAARQLARNAVVEIGLGLGVLAIVGVIGILPPGLHTEPGWPFPYRLDVSNLSPAAALGAAFAFALAACGAIAAVAAAAAARYRAAAWAGATVLLCATAGVLPLGAAVEPAYPTSFYAPAEPYAAASVVRGAAIYPANCAPCHGSAGEGSGPAAVGLPIRPANLTEPHLLAHKPGDLFWWISNGKGTAMPGFAQVLTAPRRWDVINFVLARAAGGLVRQTTGQIMAAGTYPVPDFAFGTAGGQQTLRQALQDGPVLLVLYVPPAPLARLRDLAAARQHLAAAGLRVVALDLDAPAANGETDRPPFVVDVSATVRAALVLFRGPDDGGETELLVDRNGDVRARWTGRGRDGLPDAATLVANAARANRFAVAAPSHAGHRE